MGSCSYTVDLDKAFAEGREYVVEMALEARKWYNDTSIDVTSWQDEQR